MKIHSICLIKNEADIPETVRVHTADQFAAERGIDRIDFFKAGGGRRVAHES